ncbi:MAG: 23S rRNA (adenine(2503)-C(2))-methyltransferase RlmN [Tissierellia bacterium]|nr:23S rRNA (adenine(2503)-C(2))-methyltransferase RlmN [Tissierellia bacterium]
MAKYLNNYTIEELSKISESLGEKAYRGKQIFEFIHKHNINSIDKMNLLPKAFRKKLSEHFEIGKIEIIHILESKLDETKKILYRLPDNNIIEGVIMKYEHGYSLCVSTQVGCKMGCSFCASTKEGLIRNLEVFEICSQLYESERFLGENIGNIVYMGSGEPLDNYDNIIKATKLLHNERGRNLGYRNFTLSTCGILNKMYKLLDEDIPINIAISVHSFDSNRRKKIMPIEKVNSIDDILIFSKKYNELTNNRITFEYTLISGVNDRTEDVKIIKQKLKNIKCIINLISLNPIEEYNGIASSNHDIIRFRDKLKKEGINVTIRRELGQDINASCGQLRRRYIKEGE